METKLPEASKIKLIATDLDGTLLNPEGKISERTRDVVRKVLEKYPEVHFVIASGRGRPATLSIRKTLGITDRPRTESLLCNGCVVYDEKGGLLWQRLLPNDLILKVHRRVPSFHCQPALVYSSGDDAIMFDEAWAKFARDVFEEQAYAEAMDRYEEMIVQDTAQVNKFCFNVNEPSELPEIVEKLKDLEKEYGLQLVYSTPVFIEYLPPETNKGTGLAQLLQHLHLRKEEVLAFGDGGNDLELLQEAGWPVAMANACDALKPFARLTTTSNAEDGVAEMLERIFLKEDLLN